jgi:hypothetical protein
MLLKRDVTILLPGIRSSLELTEPHDNSFLSKKRRVGRVNKQNVGSIMNLMPIDNLW